MLWHVTKESYTQEFKGARQGLEGGGGELRVLAIFRVLYFPSISGVDTITIL